MKPYNRTMNYAVTPIKFVAKQRKKRRESVSSKSSKVLNFVFLVEIGFEEQKCIFPFLPNFFVIWHSWQAKFQALLPLAVFDFKIEF